jgi:hypothetical protein
MWTGTLIEEKVNDIKVLTTGGLKKWRFVANVEYSKRLLIIAA